MGFLSGQFCFFCFKVLSITTAGRRLSKMSLGLRSASSSSSLSNHHPHPTSSSSSRRISAKSRTSLALLPSSEIVPSRHQISSSSSNSSQGKKAARISPPDHCRLTRRHTTEAPARSHSSVSRRRRSRHPKTASRGD
uniref:Uncharacterized protein n=1 Tax=Trichogramma kaykai TaxID=54128 RepID=A0ABD2WY32_9HYME